MTTRIHCPPLSSDSSATAQRPDFEAIKARQQATWSSGDYARVGVTIQLVGELLCEAVDVHAGERVLDVATGNGGTALAAARRFADVVGIDYVPALLQRGRERATSEQLPVDFREGDAEHLPVPDASFDVVLSTFGVMFAPDHERAARELVRVCKKGGKIGLTCWTPEGVLGETFRLISKYVPAIPGVEPAMSWGSEQHLRKLFGASISEWRLARKDFRFRYRSFEHFLDLFRTYYGPMHKTFAALDAEKQALLARDLRELLIGVNDSGDQTLAYPAEYLEIVLTKA